MTTIQADQPKAARTPRNQNNFNIIRLIAALFVMVGHEGYIAATAVPAIAGLQVHTIGVSIFFVIGGYLITNSWSYDPHPLRYGLKRFMRIWPPFAVFVLLMAYAVGPLLSNLGAEGYFGSWYTSYLWNLRLFIVYALPGVFTEVPYANVVNGSLWTIPVEAALYVLCPLIIAGCGLVRKEKVRENLLIGVAAAGCVLDLYVRWFIPGASLVFYGTDWVAALHLVVYFLIGMAYTVPRVRKLLNIQVAAVLLCALVCLEYTKINILLWMLILPYVVFSFAFTEKPIFARFGTRFELSYGIYLYGFLFQQLVMYFNMKNGWGLGFVPQLVLALIPTFAAAWLSCVLIEQPLQRLTKLLTKKK